MRVPLPANRQKPADSSAPTRYAVTLALYEAPHLPPDLLPLEDDDFATLVDRATTQVHAAVRERGGQIPFPALREVIANLLHAGFQDATISVAADGGTVCVADHGPGIPEPEKALRPGFSSASSEMRRWIRGVGSGLPVARELLAQVGGQLRIDENLGGGAAVVLEAPTHNSTPSLRTAAGTGASPATSPHPAGNRSQEQEYATGSRPTGGSPPALTDRQRAILLLLGERGEAGPSCCAQELDISISSAYRDLVSLEAAGLVERTAAGKRSLTPAARGLVARLPARP